MMTWLVKTKDTSDKTIAGLLEYGTAEIIGDGLVKLITDSGMKTKIENSYNVISVNRFYLL